MIDLDEIERLATGSTYYAYVRRDDVLGMIARIRELETTLAEVDAALDEMADLYPGKVSPPTQRALDAADDRNNIRGGV